MILAAVDQSFSHSLHDALLVGLALGVIYACTYVALALIATRDALAPHGGRWEAMRRRRDRALLEAVAYPEEPEPAPEIVLPVERRTRPARMRDVGIEWEHASPEDRAAAVLEVLPLHADDDNGITAKSVAHRLGLEKPQQVVNALRQLREDGRATSHWQKQNNRRVYWRSTPK